MIFKKGQRVNLECQKVEIVGRASCQGVIVKSANHAYVDTKSSKVLVAADYILDFDCYSIETLCLKNKEVYKMDANGNIGGLPIFKNVLFMNPVDSNDNTVLDIDGGRRLINRQGKLVINQFFTGHIKLIDSLNVYDCCDLNLYRREHFYYTNEGKRLFKDFIDVKFIPETELFTYDDGKKSITADVNEKIISEVNLGKDYLVTIITSNNEKTVTNFYNSLYTCNNGTLSFYLCETKETVRIYPGQNTVIVKEDKDIKVELQ